MQVSCLCGLMLPIYVTWVSELYLAPTQREGNPVGNQQEYIVKAKARNYRNFIAIKTKHSSEVSY
jgi:hypothetical protein